MFKKRTQHQTLVILLLRYRDSYLENTLRFIIPETLGVEVSNLF